MHGEVDGGGFISIAAAAFFVIPLFRMGRPAICPYSATMVPNLLQGYVHLYASSDSAGTWSVAEEMGVS